MLTIVRQSRGWLVSLCALAAALWTAPVLSSGGGPGLSPAQIVQKLVNGNGRFLAGKSEHPNADAKRRAETAQSGQKPFVTIVSCSDSRVPPEILFDSGIGDLFVIRVAGNVCDVDEIGTIEYGVEHLGTPLLLVMGHSKCGAVTAVVKKVEVGGSIPRLVDNIAPAVDAARKAHPDLEGDALVPEAITANIWQGIEDILKNSEIVRERVATGKLRIEGAFYDVEKGEVKWLGRHAKEAELLGSGSPVHEKPVSAHVSTQPAVAAHGTSSAPAKREAPHNGGTARAEPKHGEPVPANTPHAGPNRAEPAHGISTQGEAEKSKSVPAETKATEKAHAEPAHAVTVTAASQPAAHKVAAPPVLQSGPPPAPHAAKEERPAPVVMKPPVMVATVPPVTENPLAPAVPAATPGPVAAHAAPAVELARPPQLPTAAVSREREGPGVLERFMANELYRQGAAHLLRGENAPAAERFRAALEIDPSLLAAMNDLAGIYYLQRDYERATELYNMVLASDGNYEPALRGAALVHATQKQYAQARELLQKVLARNNRDAQTWLDLGDVLFLMGDAPAARQHWTRASQVDASAKQIVQKANQRLAVHH